VGVFLRKESTGASSHGYEWTTPGAVVEVTDEHAAELLAIQDAGFSVADGPDKPVKRASRHAKTDEAE
jgi:hypothetical protein